MSLGEGEKAVKIIKRIARLNGREVSTVWPYLFSHGNMSPWKPKSIVFFGENMKLLGSNKAKMIDLDTERFLN